MNSKAKILIPNKEWLITDNNQKIGSISKVKKGYEFLRNGDRVIFKNLNEVQQKIGSIFFEESIKKIKDTGVKTYSIYDYPCKSKPFAPVYDIKKRLPIFITYAKSKSQFCAGYYVVFRKKGWVASFCPKLITLERYPYYGPFKTEEKMLETLNRINKNETT
jgi:hypothetical protein